MACSEAQRLANQANAARSTGPKTEAGKAVARRNSLNHGLTGAEIVLPHEDEAAVASRFADFAADLRPEGGVAHFLTRRLALLSVWLDRAAIHEAASLTERIRELATTTRDVADGLAVDPEAAMRAQFDPSAGATLARRYEAATERAFFQTPKEIRQGKSQAITMERLAVASPAAPATELASLGAGRSEAERVARSVATTPILPHSGFDRGPDLSIRSADHVQLGRPPGR